MAKRFRLENGFTVVLEEQHAAKVAAFQVWVKIGSADERPDQAGLAHLHEHMLFKGTKTRGPGQMAQVIEASGGEVNAWTSLDQTVYHTVIASEFARVGLEILGDAVRSPAFDPDELHREIEVVCEEIKRSQDNPGRRSSQQLFAAAYQQHPYQRPVIGWEETVRSFTRPKVLEFYERHYLPENMVLSACGDLDESLLRGWVQEIFGGSWDRVYPGPVTRAPEAPPSSRRIHLREDDATEVYLNVAYPIPNVGHPDVPALDALAMMLGQGDSSWLALEVKRKRALVNDISTYAYTPRDPGLFVVTMTLPVEKLSAALEQTVLTLRQAKELEAPAEELSTIQALVESNAIYQRETVQGVARKMGFYEAGAGGIEAETRYYEDMARLKPADLQRVARRYLQQDQASVTALIPKGSKVVASDLDSIFTASETGPVGVLPKRKLPKPFDGLSSALVGGRKGTSEIVVQRLASGATVVVREERSVPLFAVRAALQGGLRYETEQDNGVTALWGRLITRGTESHDAEQISHLLDALSGSLGGATGRNSVGLRGEFLSKHFDRAFSLFAECLNSPAFSEDEVQREQKLLLEDIRTREDKPSGVAFDLFARTLFAQHPYRFSLIGEKASVERLTQDTLRRYQATYLHPSRLTLCVMGDVQVDQVLKRAEESFGKAQGTSPLLHAPSAEAAWTGTRHAKRTLARAQSHMVLGFPGETVDSPWRFKLEALSTILSGQGGRLFVELRDKRSLAYSVSSFAIEGVDPGYFAVYMGTSPEKVEAAMDGIRSELMKIRDELVSPAELQRAQRYLIGSHEIGLQRNSARAALLALDHAYGMGSDNFLNYAKKIAAITVDDIQEVARRIIDFNRCTWVVVGP